MSPFSQIRLYDILKTVDDYPIAGWKMEDILRLLVGKEGTQVALGFRRSADWDGNGVAQGETDFNVTLVRSIRALPRDHIPGTVSVMPVSADRACAFLNETRISRKPKCILSRTPSGSDLLSNRTICPARAQSTKT